MHGAVGEKAAYGKMPRDLGWKLLMDHGMQTTLNNRGLLQKGITCGIYDFPSYNHPKGKGNKGGIIDKTYTHGGSAVAKPGSKKDKKERTYKDNQEYWEDRVDYITNKSGMPKTLYQNESQLTDLLKNLKKLVRNGDPKAKSPNNIISTETNASLQFVELLHLYAVLYKTWNGKAAPTGPGNIQFTDSGMTYFNWVMGKFFYFSQKKGSAFGANFGPFGKLY